MVTKEFSKSRPSFLLGLLLVMISTIAYSQNLDNSEWSQIKAERKDGSKIIDNTKDNSQTFLFTKDSVTMLFNNSVVSKQPFKVQNKELIIGPNKFKIDTVNKSVLVLTEIYYEEVPEDRIRRFTFVNRSNYFYYLLQKGQIKIVSDSVIQLTDKSFPIYTGKDINKELLKQLLPTTSAGNFSGSILLSRTGEVIDVLIETDDFTKKEINKIQIILNNTNKQWAIPKIDSKYKALKLYFSCELTSIKSPSQRSNFSSFSFKFNNEKIEKSKQLTVQQLDKANDHFIKGLELLNGKKFEKAVTEFTSCLRIDSTYLDAYYNRAYSFYQLNNHELACQNWKKLMDLGQKQGEKLYKENCN